MQPVFPIAMLVLLFAAPAAAQDTRTDCSAVKSSMPCPRNGEEERWEQVIDAIHEFTVDPVRQTGADSRRRMSAIQGEIQRGNRDRPRLEVAAEGASERTIRGRERGSTIGDASSARRSSEYENALNLLRASGMASAEACALATAHAFGVDLLTAGRRCVTESTGADSYQEFIEALLAGNVSARDACLAAEHYWNGLSVERAQMACDSEAE